MHDKNGRPLSVGDVVLVECKVTTCHAGTDFCNLTVETVEPMYPGTNRTTITLNAKQVTKQCEGEDGG